MAMTMRDVVMAGGERVTGDGTDVDTIVQEWEQTTVSPEQAAAYIAVGVWDAGAAQLAHAEGLSPEMISEIKLDEDRYPDGAGYALANGDVLIHQLLGAVEEEASRWR